MSRQRYLDAFKRPSPNQPYRPATGSATSIATRDLMEITGAFFPEVHQNGESMARLALYGHTILGFDNVMPVFSTRQEDAALGVPMDWGSPSRMPTGKAIFDSLDELPSIPADFLKRPSMQAVRNALTILKREMGTAAAVQGKVMGPWTLAYDLYGLENFLVATLEEPDKVKRVLRRLMRVTLESARAQIEAGADCLTVADHCTRDLCAPEAYRDFLAELHSELAAAISAPLALHICGDTSDRIRHIRGTGMAIFHFDSKTGTERAVREADGLPLMGGTCNLTIIRNGEPEAVAADVEEKWRHKIAVIGPECAVPLDTPSANLRLLSDEVEKRRGAAR